MHKIPDLKEMMTMPNPNFSMKVMPLTLKGIQSRCIHPHWHEEMELLYFTAGKAIIQCNDKEYDVKAGDLIVVNCNEFHSGINLTEEVSYYCIILHPDLLHSRGIDQSDSKFINPILENTILFDHHIQQDKEILSCIDVVVEEYHKKQLGYELAIKSSLYRLFVLLMRHHVHQVLTDTQTKQREKNIHRFNEVIDYLNKNYNKELSLDHVSQLAHMSKYHFCRLFKQMTGKNLSTYVNTLRVEKAELLLVNSRESVSEIAFQVGFKDTSYFSRQFKNMKGCTPTEKRRQLQKP